jgi:hypothetical protein
MDDYEQRIIGYADILGWKASCYDLSQYTLLQTAAEAIAGYGLILPISAKESILTGVEFSFFSDNFAISAPIDRAQGFFDILALATQELLDAQFLVRGAVTMGGLYHQRGIIFGPALIEAVNMEQNDACYPRLLCSERLREFLDKTDYKEQVLMRDLYQHWVVNIACSNIDAQDKLDKIVDKQLATLTEFADKWQYMQKMLPLMYEARGISG